MAQIRTMLVSERLEMRLHGSPEPENDKGYTMYPNWQLRMEIADAKALEAKLEALERGLTIKISDGDVFLVFPDTMISIEGMCRFGMLGPIVRQNLRTWRDEILATAQKEQTDE